MMKKLFLLLLPLIAMTSCGDDNGSITVTSKSPISLLKGEQFQIEASSEQPIRYGSLDEFHATVDDNGLVTAVYVGKTQVRLKTDDDTKFIDINVYPSSSLLVEPHNTDFTIRRPEFIKMYGDKYTTLGDDLKTLVYDVRDNGYGASEYFIFHFNDSSEKAHLVKSQVILKAGTNIADVRAFLAERYKQSDSSANKYQNTLDGGAGTVFAEITTDDAGIITISYTVS